MASEARQIQDKLVAVMDTIPSVKLVSRRLITPEEAGDMPVVCVTRQAWKTGFVSEDTALRYRVHGFGIVGLTSTNEDNDREGRLADVLSDLEESIIEAIYAAEDDILDLSDCDVKEIEIVSGEPAVPAGPNYGYVSVMVAVTTHYESNV